MAGGEFQLGKLQKVQKVKLKLLTKSFQSLDMYILAPSVDHFLKMGQSRPRWFARDSNLQPQDGRCRRNHGAFICASIQVGWKILSNQTDCFEAYKGILITFIELWSRPFYTPLSKNKLLAFMPWQA